MQPYTHKAFYVELYTEASTSHYFNKYIEFHLYVYYVSFVILVL